MINLIDIVPTVYLLSFVISISLLDWFETNLIEGDFDGILICYVPIVNTLFAIIIGSTFLIHKYRR